MPSYSHLRGRTRGPLPLLCDYARASRGKPVDWLKRDERRKLVGTLKKDRMTNVHDVTLCEWLDRDRSGWCIGTNAFAIKTDTTTRVFRGNGTSSCDSRLPAARGVWIWAKENDMGGSFHANAYTSSLYVFSWNFCCSVNDCSFLFFSFFLYLFVCLFGLSRLDPPVKEWIRDRRPGEKVFMDSRRGPLRWLMIGLSVIDFVCFFEEHGKLEEYLSLFWILVVGTWKVRNWRWTIRIMD